MALKQVKITPCFDLSLSQRALLPPRSPDLKGGRRVLVVDRIPVELTEKVRSSEYWCVLLVGVSGVLETLVFG